MKAEDILNELEVLFPNAHCELIHSNPFELTVAVMLSAQTTDVSVNKVTPKLFEDFPTPEALGNADIHDIENHIRQLGLYRNKAKNIKAMSKELIDRFNGEVPKTMKELTSLSGVGRKSANVILSECFNIPSLAVDTHVERVSKRLGLAKLQDNVLDVEMKLRRKIKKERWTRSHHLFIFFGRYLCKAKNPECDKCPFTSFCKKEKVG